MYKTTLFDKGSVAALDAYLESKKQYLYVENFVTIALNRKVYKVNFILSNKIEVGKCIVRTNITMTEFKKLYTYDYINLKDFLSYKKKLKELNRTQIPKLSAPVVDFLELLQDNIKENSAEQNTGKLILFKYPISINAQSSKNRTGYGNEYYYDQLIYEGTKYGETSSFPIVGYVMEYDNYLTRKWICHI